MQKLKLTDQFKTKNGLAYQEIKTRIIEGHYKPGGRIVIQAVAKEFGISDIPVREALKMLEADGFLQNIPHTGFVVTQPDFKSQRQIFEVRQLLEGKAVALAAKTISTKELGRLRQLLRKMRRVCETDMVELGKLNYQFHDTIYAACGNQILYKLIQQVWAMSSRARSIFSLIEDRGPSSVEEHEQIYRYLESREADLAREALLRHKQRSYDLLMQFNEDSLQIHNKQRGCQ